MLEYPWVAPIALLATFSMSTAVLAAGGTITGVVTTDKSGGGTLRVTQDAPQCGKSVDDETLMVAGGKLANAVVYLEKVRKGEAAKPKEATINQTKCRYLPHVQAVSTGSKLTIINNDAVMHNVHSYIQGNRTLFNLAMPMKNQKITKTLGEAGLVSIKCDAGHTWMSAYIHVFDHPYYSVTGADGSFSIENVPKGRFKITVWHEKLGTQTQRVSLQNRDAVKVDFEL